MALMSMKHDQDPKKEILDRSNVFIDEVHLTGAQVLIGIYVRPEKTKGGLLLPDNTRSEDIYQGKAALILKMGPVPIDAEDEVFFGDRLPQVGDWIAIRPSDGFPIDFGVSGGKQPCRILSDRRQIKVILNAPDLIW